MPGDVDGSAKILSPPPEKQQKMDDGVKSSRANVFGLDVVLDSDSDGESAFMTEEEFEPYNKMVTESDGYYVPEGPDRPLMGYIRNEGIASFRSSTEEWVQYAIEYNKSNKTETEKKELKFVKLVNHTMRMNGYLENYITFEAEDEATAEVSLFQTLIWVPIGEGEWEVEQFREKPDDGY